MLQDAAIPAHSVKRSGETPAVIALDLALTRALDPQRLTRPQLAPALARRMRDHGMRACILPRVSGFVPRVNAVQVDYTAGYGNAAAVPGPIKRAIRNMVAHMYSHRGDGCDAGDAYFESGASAIVGRYRVVKI